MIGRSRLLETRAPPATVIIRLMTGAVFLLEGLTKFLFVEQWGAGRFAHIGLPRPEVLALCVGAGGWSVDARLSRRAGDRGR